MPKITPEIENKIKELALSGLNCTDIAKNIGCITRMTVQNWTKKNGIKIKKGKPKNLELEGRYDLFETLLRSGKTITQARDMAKIATGSAHRIVKERNLRKFVRTRSQAALEDKAISLEEATARLPEGSGKAIFFGMISEYNKSMFKIEAPDGFIYYKARSALHQGDPRNKSGTKISLEEVKKELFFIGYEYISGWSIKRKPIKAKHIECGYIRENRLSNFHLQGCPKCTNTGTSNPEEEIREWVQSLGLNTEKFKFKAIKTNYKSLDIYVPELKLAIEHNGLYFHSVVGLKRSHKNYTESDAINYHYSKMKNANQLGIRVINIFANEWIERKNQIKNFLKSSLGIYETKISGNKTHVKEIDNVIGNNFIEENHIQGPSRNSFKHFGLFYNEKLVGVMSFGTHPRGYQDGTVYLDRLCFLDGFKIHGGASKLLSVAKNWASDKGYEGISSHSDNRWSEGKVYEKMGFHLFSESGPDFYYVKGMKLFSKGSIRNKNIDENNTIWDCGKKKWMLSLE